MPRYFTALSSGEYNGEKGPEKEGSAMSDRTLISDFTEGSISRQLIRFATPLFLSSLLQIIYNTVDMVIVGQKLGQTGLSAVAVGGDITNFLTFFAMGISNAGQIIISQYVGSGQHSKLGKFIATMFTTLLSCAMGISVVCLLLRQWLLQLMNTPAAAYEGALAYSTVCIAGLVFIYGYNVTSAILRGMGDSRHPFIFISIAAVLNIVLDILFVLVLPLGCMGAALATVISQAVSFLLSARFLYTKRDTFNLQMNLSFFREVDRSMLGNLLKLGLPMAIKSASIQFSKLFVNSWINSYGVSVSAFAGIANKVNSISALVSNATNTAGSSIVGQNIGAKRYDRVPKIIATIAAFTLSLATLLSALVALFPQQVFGIFTSEADVLRIGYQYVPIAALIFFGSSSRSPMNALINGSGNHKINFVTAILDGIVMRIGLSLLFGLALGYGYMGFWLGDALAGFTPVFIGIIFFLSGKWKKTAID